MASPRAWVKFLESLSGPERKVLEEYVGGEVISPNELIYYQKNDPQDRLVRQESYRLGLMDSLFRKAPPPKSGLELYRGHSTDPIKEGYYDYFVPTSKNRGVAGAFGPVKRIVTTPRVRYLDIDKIFPGFDYQDPNYTVGGSEHEFLLPRGGVMKQTGEDDWLYDYLKQYCYGGAVGR